MSEITGTIFNIQRYSIHDGVGIRTLIFMKGCPLNCYWCSNPESQNSSIEIMDVKTNCIGCGKCFDLCKKGAIDSKTYDIDRNKCISCGDCTKFCFSNAKKVVGETVTVGEMLKAIEKDRVFYRNSDGGVTIGGGEPLMQSDFVAALLKSCRELNINTALETCGYGKWDVIRDVFQNTDHVFMDIKFIDSDKHKKLTGVGNELILENATRIAKLGKEITFRTPIIPTINDDKENILGIGEFVKKLSDFNHNMSLELLPYHSFGSDKYNWLNREYKLDDIKPPEEASIDNLKEMLKSNGIIVV